MNDHLGVGSGAELVALLHQLGTQQLVVLDNAVVNQGDALVRNMRVGVDRRGFAVGRPTGVGNTGTAQHWSQLLRFFKFTDLAQLLV